MENTNVLYAAFMAKNYRFDKRIIKNGRSMAALAQLRDSQPLEYAINT